MNLLTRMTVFSIVVLGIAGCDKSLSDATINGRVKMAIASDSSLQGAKVNVSTHQKVVLLSGTVRSREERAMLIAAARKVDGVKAVKTDLVVQAQAQSKPTVQARRTAAEPRRKPDQRAQLKATPPGPGVPPER